MDKMHCFHHRIPGDYGKARCNETLFRDSLCRYAPSQASCDIAYVTEHGVGVTCGSSLCFGVQFCLT